MKTLTLFGHLGRDAELRSTGDGTKLASFSVAVDDGYGQAKTTMWFDCSLFGKRGETLAPMLKKGQGVTLAGHLGTREHKSKTYLTINVQQATLTDRKGG